MTINNSDLVWVGSNSSRNSRSNSDVSITRIKSQNRYSFIFRHDVYQLFTGTLSFEYCIWKNKRIYFKEFDPKDNTPGLKISANNGPNGYSFTKNPDLEVFVGNYTMHYNEDRDLYYIERSGGSEDGNI